MKRISTSVKNERGIHARPSAVIVQSVQEYAGTTRLSAKGQEIDLKNIMELLSLGLFQDDLVEVIVSGTEEDKVCQDLAALFETHFDFPPRE